MSVGSCTITNTQITTLLFCRDRASSIGLGALSRQRWTLRSFFALLARAGLPVVRFHDLHHSCATLLLAGVHVKVVREVLGHSNIGLTLDTYSHVLPSMQADAAAKMEALFTAAN